MKKTLIMAFVVSVFAAVSFVWAGTELSKSAWFLPALVFGFSFLGLTLRLNTDYYAQRNAERILLDKLDAEGVYEVFSVSEVKRMDAQGFMLGLRDLKNDEYRWSWQSHKVPPGFKEVENGDRTFLISEKETLMLNMLPIYGLTVKF